MRPETSSKVSVSWPTIFPSSSCFHHQPVLRLADSPPHPRSKGGSRTEPVQIGIGATADYHVFAPCYEGEVWLRRSRTANQHRFRARHFCILALAPLGERVDRIRRFHQPGETGEGVHPRRACDVCSFVAPITPSPDLLRRPPSPPRGRGKTVITVCGVPIIWTGLGSRTALQSLGTYKDQAMYASAFLRE